MAVKCKGHLGIALGAAGCRMGARGREPPGRAEHTGYDGVSNCDSKEELLALMRSGVPGVPRPPPAPVEPMNWFVSALGAATHTP